MAAAFPDLDLFEEPTNDENSDADEDEYWYLNTDNSILNMARKK